MKFFNQYKWLVPLLSFTAVVLLMRMVHTRTFNFFFIPWNLVLAGIPLVFSYWISKVEDKTTSWGLFFLWLLFFPNAMYIVTDLFHLNESTNVPKWFDLLLLFSAALNGVLMGLSSLYNIEQFLKKNISVKYVPVVVFSLLLLCGYGIYLGRYMRWNSWDIFTQPFGLLMNIAHDVKHPLRKTDSWMLSGLFATWLFILYRYATQVFSKKQTQETA